jgi:hypothetical protein
VKPSSFIIEGATGNCASKVNGTYEATDENQFGLPVYIKKGDSGVYIEAAKGSFPLRWYVKPKENRGPDSDICFGYIAIEESKSNALTLPYETQGKWKVNTADGFKQQDAITCKEVTT